VHLLALQHSTLGLVSAHLAQFSTFEHVLAHVGTFQHIWVLLSTLVLLLTHLVSFSTSAHVLEHLGRYLDTGNFQHIHSTLSTFDPFQHI